MRKCLVLFLLIGSVAWAFPLNEAPHGVSLNEKKFPELSNQDFSDLGTKALAIAPAKWRHAETENFIIHYHTTPEAFRVVHEIEFDLWFAAKTLGVAKDRYTRKSHVFIFQNEQEWNEFHSQTNVPEWSASFAHGDELFLHVGGVGEGFDSHLLAHETTHAVVARLYPRHTWPMWLNEGFAEYIGGATVAARKGVYLKHAQNALQFASMPLDQLTALTQYPTDTKQVHALYQSSEKLIRFLMGAFPQDRFTRFIDTVLTGETFEKSVLQIYGDKVQDFATFKRNYERFVK